MNLIKQLICGLFTHHKFSRDVETVYDERNSEYRVKTVCLRCGREYEVSFPDSWIKNARKLV